MLKNSRLLNLSRQRWWHFAIFLGILLTVSMLLLYPQRHPITLDIANTQSNQYLKNGFYPSEQTPLTQEAYRWTNGNGVVSLPAIGHSAWDLTLVMQTAFPEQSPADVRIKIAKYRSIQLPPLPEKRMVHVFIPSNVTTSGDLDLAIQSNTYREQAQTGRSLGVIVYGMNTIPLSNALFPPITLSIVRLLPVWIVLGLAFGFWLLFPRLIHLLKTKNRQVIYRELLGISAMLAIIAIFGFRLIGSTVNVPGDIASVMPPWHKVVAGPVENPITIDVLVAVYPNRLFVNNALQNGELPLWDPQILNGHSLAASPNSQIFYPITLALGNLSAGNALDIQMLIHLIIGGFGMYCLIRIWGGGYVGAVVGTTVLLGCSALTVWQQYPYLFSTGVWLPWLLLALERAYTTHKTAWRVIGACVLGLMLLANFIQWTLYSLFVVGVYTVCELIWQIRHKDYLQARHIIVSFCVICLLGVLIGAVQLLPFIESALQSNRVQGFRYADFKRLTLPTKSLITAIMPNFYGEPKNFWGRMNYSEATIYWGFLPLILAFLTPLLNRERKALWIWLTFLLTASIMLGFFTLYIFFVLPGFNNLFALRLIYLVCFCGALLTGLNIEKIFNARKTLAIVGTIILLNIFVTLISNNLYATFKHTPTNFDSSNFVWIRWLSLALIIGLILHTFFKHRLSLMLIALIIIFDIFHFSLPFNQKTMPETAILPKLDIFKYIPENSRVAPLITNMKDAMVAFLPNSLQSSKVQQITGYDSLVTKNHRRLFNLINKQDYSPNQNMILFSQPNSPLIDLLGIDFMISDHEIITQTQFLLIAKAQGLFLYQNSQPTKGFMVNAIDTTNQPDAVWQVLGSANYNPCSDSIVLADQAPTFQQAEPQTCIGNVELLDLLPNSIHYATSATSDGFLIVPEVYYRGWEAYVDGTATPIYQTNGVFRGVAVPAGEHTIDFVFRPNIVYVGIGLSLLGIIIALLMLFWPRSVVNSATTF